MDRIILNLLIDRVSSEFGEVSRKEFAQKTPEWNRSGRGHLAAALYQARRALASNDGGEIRQAALLCPALERTGRAMVLRSTKLEKQQKAAKARGAKQRAVTVMRWAPYEGGFQKLVDSGVPERVAKATVTRMMNEDGFLPDARTIQRHLKKKNRTSPRVMST